MESIEELKKMVMASASLADDEKQVICLLLPYMKQNDIRKISGIFSAEKEVLDSLPDINAMLADELKNAFETSFEVYGGYKKDLVSELEENISGKEMVQAEKDINDL